MVYTTKHVKNFLYDNKGTAKIYIQVLSSFIALAFLNRSSLIFYKTFLGKQWMRGDNGLICAHSLFAHV